MGTRYHYRTIVGRIAKHTLVFEGDCTVTTLLNWDFPDCEECRTVGIGTRSRYHTFSRSCDAAPRRVGSRSGCQQGEKGELAPLTPGVARYETVTSKTQRLAPPSLDSFRRAWTGRPKTASNVSF